MDGAEVVRPHATARQREAAWMTLALALAQPLSTGVWRWTSAAVPEVDRARVGEGPLTPAPGAFVIWGPLFASAHASALADVHAVRTGRAAVDPSSRRWWRLTLLGTVAWNLHAQFRGLGAGSVVLIAASAVAATTALAREGLSDGGAATPAQRLFRGAVAPLAGWLTLATAANVETALNRRRGRPASSGHEALRASSLLVGVGVTAGLVVRRLGAVPGYVLALGWGAAGIAAKAARTPRGIGQASPSSSARRAARWRA